MWYLRVDGKTHGPIDEARFAQLEFANKIPKTAEKSTSPDGPWQPAIVDNGMTVAMAKLSEPKTADPYAHLYEDDEPAKGRGKNRNTAVINSISFHAFTYAFLSAIGMLFSLGTMLGTNSIVSIAITIVGTIWVGIFSYHVASHLIAGSHYYTQRLREMGKSQE
jgi:hypothetical protein